MCLAQGSQHSDVGEARTRSPSVSSQAHYHLANTLPWFLTQEDPSQHNWNIVDWDVKNQSKQIYLE